MAKRDKMRHCRPRPNWQKNQPHPWLIECDLKVSLCVAVAVEHRPKYQHKRFIELGRQGMGNPPSNPASGSASLNCASATVFFAAAP